MKLILGRDHATNKLKVSYGSQSRVFTDLPEMPKDISEHHCEITLINDDAYILTRLKGLTTVNGFQVVTKKIKVTDVVKLGKDGFVVPLARVLGTIVSSEVSYDISHLKAIWDQYKYGMMKLKLRQKNNNLLFRIPMAFTLLGSIVSTISESLRPITIIPTVLAFVVMMFGLYRAATDKSIQKEEQLKSDFRHNYVCPNCKSYLNYQDYDMIIRNMSHCPKCKAKFKHE